MMMLRALQSLKGASHLPSISAVCLRHGDTYSIFPSPAPALPSKEWRLRQAVARMSSAALVSRENPKVEIEKDDGNRIEHAVISTFDLFSIGVGPSSSHTVGPLRAAKIFILDLEDAGILRSIHTLKVTLYGSLAATGKGHMTPQALMMGFQGCDPETIDTSTINARYENLLSTKILEINGRHRIKYDMDRDMVWRWDQVLPTHPNGMRFSAFDQNGDLLATNEYYSVGGGFVVNEKTKIDENLFYKGVDKSRVAPARLSQAHGMDSTLTGLLQPSPVQNSDSSPESSSDPYKSSQPRYLFHSGDSLLALTRKHNLTIAQLVYENELHYLSPDEIHDKLFKIWGVMDECIRTGVSTTEETLPGRLQLKRRAPALYRRLMKGFYPAIYAPSSNPAIAAPTPDISDSHLDVINPTASLNPMSARAAPQVTNGSDRPPASVTPTIPSMRRKLVRGKLDHPIPPMPTRKASFPGIDFLSCYAIAVNEVNASGGRIVTSPTNGASGVIPAVLKYILEFLSEDPQRDISTFLLTASAIGMLFKRGSTISAAEGGCQAEVGVACSMAAAGFSACMGASPEIILQSAEIGIEHNLGLTCDPIDGLVQVPCIERNSLGAIKAVTAAQLAMASGGVHSVTLDEAIAAMRMTATDMSEKYKETSLGGLATTVRIPLTSPAC